MVGGTRFYERKEIKDALAYLRVLVNPDDDVNLRRIINEPKRGIGTGRRVSWPPPPGPTGSRHDRCASRR